MSSGGIFGRGVVSRGLSKIFQPQRAAEIDRLHAGIDDTVRQTAWRLGIECGLDRKPYQLSGGERQRVALGRAIVRKPAAFLFEETLSNLDARRCQKLLKIWRGWIQRPSSYPGIASGGLSTQIGLSG